MDRRHAVKVRNGVEPVAGFRYPIVVVRNAGKRIMGLPYLDDVVRNGVKLIVGAQYHVADDPAEPKP